MSSGPGEIAGNSTSGVRRRRPLKTTLYVLLILLIAYLLMAYLLLPWGWRRHESSNAPLRAIPRVTHTASGIPGDPLNVALVGAEDQVITMMLAARWYPADPITLKSSL